MEFLQSNSLNGENTRIDIQNATKQMMDRFNRLNEEYNKIAEQKLSGKVLSDDDNVYENDLIQDQEKVFYMINKAKICMKQIREKKDKLTINITDYEECRDYCQELLDGIEKLLKIYKKINDKFNFEIDSNNDFSNFITKNSNIENDTLNDTLNGIKHLQKNIDNLIFHKKEELKICYKKINEFNSMVRQCFENEEEINLKNKCSVCVSYTINSCLNPCGHVFCSNCINKMKNKCAMCRTNINSVIKMYLEDGCSSDNDEASISGNVVAFSGFNNSQQLQSSNLYGYLMN
jgi:hypothetical protein